MDIITSKLENLDKIVFESKYLNKEMVVNYLEKKDQEIAAIRDKNRYEMVSCRSRTLLTSIGCITYKRRYYYDHIDQEYVYLLDNQLELPKYTRYSNELRINILKMASELTYRVLGREISYDFTLGKSTIYKIIKDTIIRDILPPIYRSNNEDVIHLQIDEKYIGMVNKRKKGKYYTATIFLGERFIRSQRVLLNKTVLSSFKLDNLANRIRDNLVNRYKVKENELIYISGDFASYIRKFNNRIDDICKPIYVPDKFHVKKTLKDEFGLLLNDYELNEKDNISLILQSVSKDSSPSLKGLARVIRKDPNCFSYYQDDKYLGCSQEGMNSHIYSSRFSKHQNRFNPLTIEKLSLIREAYVNHAQVRVISSSRKSEEIKMINLNQYRISFDFIRNDINVTKVNHKIRIIEGLLI